MPDEVPERTGRPYPDSKLRSMQCHCCQQPARFQWNACADGNVWRALCPACDVRINIAVLQVLDPKRWRVKVRAYCKEINFRIPKEWLK